MSELPMGEGVAILLKLLLPASVYDQIGAWCGALVLVPVAAVCGLFLVEAVVQKQRFGQLAARAAVTLLFGALAVVSVWAIIDSACQTPAERGARVLRDMGGKLAQDEDAPGNPVVMVSFSGSSTLYKLGDAQLPTLVEYLRTLPRLRQLDLDETDVTRDGEKLLVNNLPGVLVTYSPRFDYLLEEQRRVLEKTGQERQEALRRAVEKIREMQRPGGH